VACRPQGFGPATFLSGSNDHDARLQEVHRVRSLAAGQTRAAIVTLLRLDTKLETINPVCKVKTADRTVGA
jgi:hypothetical protein